MSKQADELKERHRKMLAQALLPYARSDWPGRWGWTALPEESKRKMFELADEIITELQLGNQNGQ